MELNGNIILIRTDGVGTVLWSQSFGGFDADSPTDLVYMQGGGFGILGETQSQGAGMSDVWLIRTDYDGSMDWELVVGSQYFDFAWSSLFRTASGGFEFLIDGYLPRYIRVDADGNIDQETTIFATTIGVDFQDFVPGAWAVGHSVLSGVYQAWAGKLDSDGNLSTELNHSLDPLVRHQWKRIVESGSGNFMLVGGRQASANPNHATSNVWVAGMDENGSLNWNTTLPNAPGIQAATAEATVRLPYWLQKTILVGYQSSTAIIPGQVSVVMWVAMVNDDGTAYTLNWAQDVFGYLHDVAIHSTTGIVVGGGGALYFLDTDGELCAPP